ncbi:MAG: hypothetical protein KY428_10780, partial [Bacteroidetes bacterium]|nr:hypothetical protein [Bacteroidota bacterium]
MKNILNKLYLITLISAALLSCEKEEEQLVATTSGTPSLSATAQTLELLESEATNEVVTLTWSAVDISWSNPDIAP